MKMKVFGVFAVLLLVVGAVSVNAQTGRRFLTVSVPFDFAVGNEILPKGEYIVTKDESLGGTVLLRGQDGSAFACTSPTEKRGGKDAYELDFYRINNQYFLASVWMGNDHQGRKLFASKREREMTAQFGKPALRILTASAR
jgi:hypothetical protein